MEGGCDRDRDMYDRNRDFDPCAGVEFDSCIYSQKEKAANRCKDEGEILTESKCTTFL